MSWIERIKLLIAGDAADGVAGLQFAFGVPMSTGVCLLLLLGLAVMTAGLYWPRLNTLAQGPRIAAVALRAAAFSLVGFLALNPIFVGTRLDRASHYVILMFDDSQSMQIPMTPDETRGQRFRRAYEDAATAFEQKLGERYQVAMYRYGSDVDRVRGLSALRFEEEESRHFHAVETALRDFQGIPVAAVVLFSDGVEQPARTAAFEHRLPEDAPPLITVGVGATGQWRDLALTGLSVTRAFGDRRPVVVKAQLTSQGLSGREVAVEVFNGQKMVASQPLVLAEDRQHGEVRLSFAPDEEGWLEYSCSVRLSEAAQGDRSDWVSQNNQRTFLVDNRPVNYPILYFCGRPNWENKFVQRVLAEDEALAVTNLLRISAAETKFVYRGKKTTLVNPLFEGFYQHEEDQPRYDEAVFLRFGGDPEDAGRGFPETAEELFAYDLLIVGDVEARFFSQTQLELVREFVRKRGGVLLFLGGPHSFSDGDYNGTVLGNLMPVLLDQKDEPEMRAKRQGLKFRVEPTIEGFLSGTWALDPNPEMNKQLWQDLPELSGANLFAMTRAGATVMARLSSDNVITDEAPFFAMQRYGEGRVAVLATGATWSWHLKTEPDDDRHGRFWRQLVRSLVLDSRKPIVLHDKRDEYVEGKAVNLAFTVKDRKYEEQIGARASLLMREPGGAEKLLSMGESLVETGRYESDFTPVEPGTYRLTLNAADARGETLGGLEEALLVTPDRREFTDAGYRPGYLRQLAVNNGGSFFELDRLGEIPERIPWLSKGQANTVTLPIWHFQGFFWAAIFLLGVEWYIRRKWGQA